MLTILPFVLGPVSTNAYLIADAESGEAVVIDPAADGQFLADEAAKRGWTIGQMWYTHAHFDHFAGGGELARALERPDLPVALHPADLDLWQDHGLARALDIEFELGPRPSIDLSVARMVSVGAYRFQVRHAPGHTRGLCIFYCAQESILFSGDLIFRRTVGRTDLPGGDSAALIQSIHQQVYTLPGETRILPGHGEETTVEEEKCENAFVRM